ncbi:type II toxin-antitoxin system VapC family toxin [Variovorax sp. PCZ-1]|uniref:type II toxin-antitoxin system VapC family toxin n=1 Tax=Variovorax sp. PCZ-1 TaxID=2835533 RepID=UPI001BCC5D6F|nr:type II toxin-antitoxin system VapC family toxin [Variovorax sp. PCZ-1]MBS7808486.1 type II toxin-antitoxin system VapC family toxin [Variovorax sp. PCZ-1]
MFLLDTNVISELTKPLPSPAVLHWFATTPAQQIYISSVTLCEIEFGLALMPAGKRRDALLSSTRELVRVDFEGRCLNLDASCAAAYGELSATQQQNGRTCSTEDAMIAAIALAHKCTLVTRNIKDFEGIIGLQAVNPWVEI